MTKLQIISKLWSAIYDLIFLIKGTPTKSLEEIEADLDVIEYACRRYADCDDDEIAIICRYERSPENELARKFRSNRRKETQIQWTY